MKIPFAVLELLYVETQTDRQTDRKTETDRKTDRQTDRVKLVIAFRRLFIVSTPKDNILRT
jgi:hypothetical protein